MENSNVIKDSIPQLMKKLCIYHLKHSHDDKRSLVMKKDYDMDKVPGLKKKLYRKLFVALKSPIVLPSSNELHSSRTQDPVSNVYDMLSIDSFDMQLLGLSEEAERLHSLLENLKELKNPCIDSVLKVFHLLLNYKNTKKQSKRLLYDSKHLISSDSLFQLDNKAFGIDYDGIDLFGSAFDVDDTNFTVIGSTDVFSLKPDSNFFGNMASVNNSKVKESKYWKETRSSLFSGLTNSLTTDMEVSLDIPALPKNSYDMQITIPVDTQQLYNESSVDEGFDESISYLSSSTVQTSSFSSNKLDVWDEAISWDKKKVYAWEKEGSYDERLDNGFITELGNDAFDCMYLINVAELEKLTGTLLPLTKVSTEKVFQDTLNVLIGVQSTLYTFHSATLSLKAAQNIHCPGVSAESLHALMTKFASLGTHYRQLRKFCSHHADRPVSGQSGGVLLKAFIDALKEILQTYWFAVFTAGDMKEMVLTELWHLFEQFAKQFKLLADVCLCSEAFKRTERGSGKPRFPVGPRLLSYLYSLAVKNSSTEHFPMLLYLFRSTSIPYINFISDWLFRGVCHDHYDEFFVQLDQQYMNNKDKYFWTQGFQMSQGKTSVPLFLDELAVQMFSCGKTITLLRLTNIKHYLFDVSIKLPTLAVTFSSKRLDEMSKENKQYLKSIKMAEQKHVEEKEKKVLEEREEWKMKIAAEKNITEDALNHIKDMENEIKKAIREKKGKELKELQAQFEEAVKERKLRREKKWKEDNEFLEEVRRIEEKDDEARKKAREEIISYYQALSQQVERRERHAQWIIDRYNLTGKREEFFKEDERKIEIEMKKAEETKAASASLEVAEIANSTDSIGSKLQEGTTSGLDENAGKFVVSSTSLGVAESFDVVDPIGSKQEDSVLDGNAGAKDGVSIWAQIEESSSKVTPHIDEKIEVKTPLLQSPFKIPKFDQNLSEAKDILYPTNSEGENSISSSYQTQYTSELESNVERRDLLGSSALEGSTAKNILYPTSEQDNRILTTMPLLLHGDEGKETKDLLYPGENKVLVTQHELSKAGEEGTMTKFLLYPGESPIDNTNDPQVNQKQLEDGAETKDLLYGPASDTSTHVSTRGVNVDEGRDLKNVLYPGNDMEDSLKPYTNKLENVEGMETKHLLYPGSFSSEGVSQQVPTSHSFDEGSGAKSVLYPGQSTNKERTDFFTPRDFENPSVMKDLLYPDSIPRHDADVSQFKSRGFEPPTRIKEMMYPEMEEKVKTVHEVRELRPEDVWMDMTVEPFQDNFTEIINQDPHPYRCWESNSHLPLQFQEEIDPDADIIKQMPLETVIKRSLISPIQAQISLVNKAVIKYFIEDLRIEAHFDAFRKFLLLEDGEFGHSLCSQLFEKISSGMKPQEFCNAIRLNNIIIEALRLSLYASRIDYSRQLTFSLKSIPDVFQPSDVGVLDFLELRYQVPWPCNIVITENSINKYNRVFSFLIRLKRAGWSLQEVWLNLKKAGHSRRTASSPQLRQLQLFRHEMQHFVNNLERYTVNQIIHVSWEEFQQDLKKVNDLDDLHRCHTAYLKKIIFRSLLTKNAAPVFKLINDIFGMISKFEARLTSQSWVEDEQSGHVTHPLFPKLQLAHSAFRQCIEFLFSVISKLVRRGYQDHLTDLLLQVNFNSYYTTAVVSN